MKAMEVQHVSVDFKKEKALNDITITLNGPGVYGMLGRNGAGKTTLLSVMANYLFPTDGAVYIDGEPLFEQKKQTSQVYFCYPKDISAETEKASKLLKRMDRMIPSFDMEVAKKLAKRFNLNLNKRASSYSTGMASMFQVVKGIATRAPITIFDEAYAGMDAPAREIFYEAIQEEQEHHPRLFIISTHYISEVEYLFDHAIILHNGSVLKEGSYEELLSSGFSVTGEASQVDAFTKGLEVLKEKTLGGTKQVVIFKEDADGLKQEAEELGFEIGSLTLQDLFTSLTKEEQQDD
ncbi:ABC transporter ATP-binding protein [Paenalkalicoccus suaedae]|uniref:ABC transporter ATP-binding protein n=1 Tax=Paenalkalicoccus suaedae TaxID=2592382 RepID=A0A859FAN4_9BACI|nr:ABC transporter ATP-binding protein [Paenalkalicoccus suaedae]QKS70393.1 ABC transporter ATP-binding protein [Paenalkalicoccus suaedae]